MLFEARSVSGGGGLRVTRTLDGASWRPSRRTWAMAWVGGNADRIVGATVGFDRESDVHMHLPAGPAGSWRLSMWAEPPWPEKRDG